MDYTYWNSTIRVKPNAKRLKGRRRLDVPGPRKNSKRVNSNRYKEEQCKKAVRARDNFQCQFPRCFTRSRSIDVHHIAMRSKRPDLKFVRENCIALCREHHIYVHAHIDESVGMGLLDLTTYEAAQKAKAA